jgi:hypothetical protein
MFCVGGPCLGVGVDPVLDMVVLLHAHLVPVPHPRVVREQDLDLLVGRDVRSLLNIRFACFNSRGCMGTIWKK